MFRMSFKIFEGFAFEHKISKSNAKVSIHYRLIGLFSEDFDIFAANIFFDFFKNVFNSKAIKICHTGTTYIQNVPITPSFIVFGNLFREKTLFNTCSFW